MKPFIVFVSCFLFPVARVATAEDVVPEKSAPQRNAGAPTAVHASAIRLPHNRSAVQGARNTPRTFPAGGQPALRARLAMNMQSQRRNHPARQSLDLPEQQQKARVTSGTFQATSPNNLRNSNRQSYFDALRRCPRERHDCNWWRQHCTTIVLVRTGYYYLDAGYWYPAFGYDPGYDYYDYDGPIYTYGNLLPDQVIANVQKALRELGYYTGPVTGSLGSGTRAALANFQRDYGLIITGAIDEPTVASLGLI